MERLTNSIRLMLCVRSRSSLSAIGSSFGVESPGHSKPGWNCWDRLFEKVVLTMLAIGFVFGIVANGSIGEARQLSLEHKVKVELLRRFAFYVEWPDNVFPTDRSPIVLGILGPDPFGSTLQELSGKEVNGRPIEVVHFESAAEIEQVHILFLNLDDNGAMAQALRAVYGAPVLTVSDKADFTSFGGMINIWKRRNHPNLLINNAAIRRAGLTASSLLLKNADVTDP